VGRGVLAALALALVAALAAGGTCGLAQASSWHLVSSFGRGGAAGLPVREEGIDSIYPPGPGATGSLLAPGPSGSTIVGGYSRHSRGTFLVAQLSSRGTLTRSYGNGGVAAVPGIYSTPQHPPWMLAAGGGKLLVVGLDRGHDLELVRLTQTGRPDRTFAGGGSVRVTLPGTQGKAMLAAAALVHGEVLVAYYRSEAAQPAGEPQRTPGLGAGPLELARVLAGGALDRSFGSSGFLRTTGAPPTTKEGEPAEGVAIAPDGSVLLAYGNAITPGTGLREVPAVQELDPSGADALSFGVGGSAYLPFVPTLQGESSSLFGALFGLAGGGVEASFGAAGELFRFTAAGALDPSFPTSGHPGAGHRTLALALAPGGETFALREAAKLTLSGTLASGAGDPALGGHGSLTLPARLPSRRGGEEQLAVELLAGNSTLTALAGEELFRVAR
jgi:hypothetical protein